MKHQWVHLRFASLTLIQPPTPQPQPAYSFSLYAPPPPEDESSPGPGPIGRPFLMPRLPNPGRGGGGVPAFFKMLGASF